MSWLSRVFNIFSREKVNVSISKPGSLAIDSSFLDASKILPGLPNSNFNRERVKDRGLSHFSTPGTLREVVVHQYDHIEVELLYDVESYFARATRAKLALFLKEGYDFIGADDLRVEYIRARFRQFERATKIPLNSLLLQTCRDLLVHSNAYWLKVRKDSASGGMKRKSGNKTYIPVAGYFPIPPETIAPEVDGYGNIIRWKQTVSNDEKYYSVDDIVHFYTNKKCGYPLGVPSIIPAIDDIRALRSLEHNIDVLIHKHLFPIVLWKVGTSDRPAKTFSDGTSEIDVVKDTVADMPTEGSIVVSERYNVEAIGAENKALRIESYLSHFRERLLAGLDVSSLDIGIGNTSSRSTAHTLSRSLMDTVKLHQIIIEDFLVSVIEELLLESTFDDNSINNPENIVKLKFHEIDKEAKQAERNHIIDSFHKNAITFPEMRIGIGREALTPEEEKELWWNKFGIEEALIRSVDESSGKGKENNSVSNNNKPENQYGTRQSAKLNRDSYASSNDIKKNPVLYWHNSIAQELHIRKVNGVFNLAEAKSDITMSYDLALRDFNVIIRNKIRANYPELIGISSIISQAQNRAASYINKLRNDVIKRLESQDLSPNIIFEALKHRAVLIYDFELARAENVAKYNWLIKNRVNCIVTQSSDPCDECAAKLTLIYWNDKLGESKIPPFHVGCQCGVRGQKV